MTKSLYEILEVKPDATQEQIRAAFIRLAKLNHPDAMGGQSIGDEAFIAIKKAYEVLKDGERRKTYDKTGAAPDDLAINELEANAMGFLLGCLNTLIDDERCDLLKKNVCLLLREIIDFKVGEMAKNISAVEKKIRRVEIVRDRLAPKDGGENIIQRSLNVSLAGLQTHLEMANRGLASMRRGADIAAQYKYDFEEIQAVTFHDPTKAGEFGFFRRPPSGPSFWNVD